MSDKSILTGESGATHASGQSSSCATSPFIVLLCITNALLTRQSKSTESKLAIFAAVWGGINQNERLYLIVDLKVLLKHKGNQYARAKILDAMENRLNYKASTEHSTNVSKLVHLLSELSAHATREMLTIAQRPPEFIDQEDNGHDMSSLSALDGTH